MAQFWLPGDSDFAKAARGWPSSPHVKPHGQLAINWHHPMVSPPVSQGSATSPGKGLRSVWLFGPGCRDLNTIDGLALDGYTLISDEGGSVADWGVGAPGQFLKCDSSGQCLNFNTDEAIPSVGSTDCAHTISCLMDFPLKNGTLNGVIENRFILSTANTITCFGHTASAALSTLTGPHRITVAQWKDYSGEFSSIYLDGVLQGTSTSNDFPGILYITGFGNNNIALNKDRGSRLYDVFFWQHRALSAASVMEHYLNPYAMLQPANQSPYLISVPAGGGAPTLSLPGVIGVQATQATPQVTLTF